MAFGLLLGDRGLVGTRRAKQHIGRLAFAFCQWVRMKHPKCREGRSHRRRGMPVEWFTSWVFEPFPGRFRQKLGKGKTSLANDYGCLDIEALRKSFEPACPCPVRAALHLEGNQSSAACQDEIHFGAVFTPIVQPMFRCAGIEQVCAHSTLDKAVPMAAVLLRFFERVS